jgi:hypothetical protein
VIGPNNPIIPLPGPGEYWNAHESATDANFSTIDCTVLHQIYYVTVQAGQVPPNITLDSTAPTFDIFEEPNTTSSGNTRIVTTPQDFSTVSSSPSAGVLGTVRRSFSPWLGYSLNVGYIRASERTTTNAGFYISVASNFTIPTKVYELSLSYVVEKHVTPRLSGLRTSSPACSRSSLSTAAMSQSPTPRSLPSTFQIISDPLGSAASVWTTSLAPT